jgi:hypothetical protein
LRDAWGFLEVAQAANDERHGNQAASNAILAAIAANDAICLRRIGRRGHGESHVEAARVLQEACGASKWQAEAAVKARQLRQIIGLKNAAQYEGEPLGPAVVDRVIRQAKRFVEWADQVVSS